MSKIDARAVMALRRLTDLPVSTCREALVEADGDLAAVVRQLRESPCFGIHATDAEVATVLASCGLTYSPPEPRQPVMLSDGEVLAELTAAGLAMSDCFLIDGLVCSVNARGELMACSIDDADLAASARGYLRRVGAPEYPSFQAYDEQREAAPGHTTNPLLVRKRVKKKD